MSVSDNDDAPFSGPPNNNTPVNVERPTSSDTVSAASEQISAVEVSWDAPSARSDGSSLPLSEIGGYEILSVNLDTQEQQRYIIESANQSRYVLSALSPGDYQLYLFAYDTDNRLSEPSVLPRLLIEG